MDSDDVRALDPKDPNYDSDQEGSPPAYHEQHGARLRGYKAAVCSVFTADGRLSGSAEFDICGSHVCLTRRQAHADPTAVEHHVCSVFLRDSQVMKMLEEYFSSADVAEVARSLTEQVSASLLLHKQLLHRSQQHVEASDMYSTSWRCHTSLEAATTSGISCCCRTVVKPSCRGCTLSNTRHMRAPEDVSLQGPTEIAPLLCCAGRTGAGACVCEEGGDAGDGPPRPGTRAGLHPAVIPVRRGGPSAVGCCARHLFFTLTPIFDYFVKKHAVWRAR